MADLKIEMELAGSYKPEEDSRMLALFLKRGAYMVHGGEEFSYAIKINGKVFDEYRRGGPAAGEGAG